MKHRLLAFVSVAILFALPASAGGPMSPSAWNGAPVSPMAEVVVPVENGGTASTSLGSTLSNSGGVLNVSIPPDRDITSSTDTILSTDGGKNVNYKSMESVAVTVPAASTTLFTTGFGFIANNFGSGDVVLSSVSGYIGKNASIKIHQNDSCVLTSNSTDYTVSSCPIFSYNPSFSTGTLTSLPVSITANNSSTIACQYFDSNGHMQFTPPGACAGRTTYDPITKEYLGIMRQKACTNLMPNSTISSENWTVQSHTTLGTTTMWGRTVPSVVIDNAGSTSTGVYAKTASRPSIIAGHTYKFQQDFRYISGDPTVYFGSGTTTSWGNGSQSAQVKVNIQTCTPISQDAAITGHTETAYTDADGVEICRVSGTAVAYATSSPSLVIYHSVALSESTFGVSDVQFTDQTVNGTDDIFSIIVTNGSAGTRQADHLSIASPYWFNNTSGTLCMNFVVQENVSGRYVFSDITQDRTPLYFATSTHAGSKDGTNTIDYDLAFQQAGTLNKTCVRYGSATSNVSLNGVIGTEGTFDNNFNMVGINLFEDYAGENGANAYLQSIKWYSYKESDTDFTADTQ